MKIKHFILEKAYVFILTAFASIVQITFLVAIGMNIDTILYFTILFWLLIITILLIEYYRKAKFYNELIEISKKLDKKALLTELVERPSFLDGQILYDVLQDLNKNLNDTMSTFEVRERQYQEYVELWVHEIKTPLAASKLIVANNQSSTTQSIEEELDKIDDFVEQALFYARSTSLEKDYKIKMLNLQDVIYKVVKKNQKVFIYKKIKIDLNNIDATVYSDSKWLEFIVKQIIDNALKYTKTDGTIIIEAQVCSNSTILKISDNGIGFSSADVARVFDRGFTGENGRTNQHATGMGLYLCKLLCDKLHIGIRAESIPNTKTSIVLTFPQNSFTQFK